MTPSAGSYHFQQQQAMDHKLGRQGSNTPKLLDASCGWPTMPQQFSPAPEVNIPASNSYVSGASASTLTNTGTANFPLHRNTNLPMYSQHNSLPYPAEPMGLVRSTPRPTIPLDRFRSVREACQDSGFLTWEKYQEFTNMTPSRSSQNLMFSNNNTAKNNNQAMGSSSFNINTISEPIKEELPDPCPTKDQMSSDVDMHMLPTGVSMSESMQHDFEPRDISVELKTEAIDECMEMSMDTTPAKRKLEYFIIFML